MNQQIIKILNQKDVAVDSGMINSEQKLHLAIALSKVLENQIEGDVVEFGCYVGESSKQLRRTLNAYYSDKQLYVYDSFEGLPPLSIYEKDSGWTPGTLKTTKEILIKNFIDNSLAPPIIVKGWFKDVPDEKIPKTISYAFLDGDFYDSIYDSLTKIYDRVSEGGIILFHDYLRPDLPGVQKAVEDFLLSRAIIDVPKKLTDQLWYIVKGNTYEIEPLVNNNLTIVTGIWDLRRDEAGEGFKRPFSHYVSKFEELLQIDANLVIFISQEHEELVWKHRSPHNTKVYYKEVDDFRNKFDGYSLVQKIRQDEKWYNQVGWLKESTQATLELYNPMVMSKMFMLHDASIFNPFNTEYFIWLDGGITSTVNQGYFVNDRILDRITPCLDKFFFISFPYDTSTEIHGFELEGMKKFSNSDTVNYVCRAGLFGGSKKYISKANVLYYRLLMDTLNQGYMGTEESIFTIMSYLEPENYQRYMIESNGLISTFAEALKNDKVSLIKKKTPTMAVYVIGFNSPKQFEALAKSWKDNSDFVNKTKNFLIDNSTDLSTTEEYIKICNDYNFAHLKQDNLGICGGRQFVAEHFESIDADYYLFLEDDMMLNGPSTKVCKNNFQTYIPDLYNKVIDIMDKEKFDFIKLSFTEFFGDNKTQWAWYNVPQSIRESVWPNKCKLPEFGLDPNAPLTKFNNIKNINGITYADGEIYYCNWPQIVSKEGNKRMFLDTTWAKPFEQTWMSHMFQLTLAKKLKPAILLASPIDHNRFEHYGKGLRKES